MKTTVIILLSLLIATRVWAQETNSGKNLAVVSDSTSHEVTITAGKGAHFKGFVRMFSDSAIQIHTTVQENIKMDFWFPYDRIDTILASSTIIGEMTLIVPVNRILQNFQEGMDTLSKFLVYLEKLSRSVSPSLLLEPVNREQQLLDETDKYLESASTFNAINIGIIGTGGILLAAGTSGESLWAAIPGMALALTGINMSLFSPIPVIMAEKALKPLYRDETTKPLVAEPLRYIRTAKALSITSVLFNLAGEVLFFTSLFNQDSSDDFTLYYTSLGMMAIGLGTSITSNTFMKKAEKALLASRKGFHLSFSKNGVGIGYNLGGR